MEECSAALNGAAFGEPEMNCEGASGYALFMISRLPNADEIPKICANVDCMKVIATIRNNVKDDCKVSHWVDIKLYAQVLDPIQAGCSSMPKTTAPPPPTAAPPPPTTAAPPPPATTAPAPKTAAPTPTTVAPVPTTASSGESNTTPSESTSTPVVSGGSTTTTGGTTTTSTGGSAAGGSTSSGSSWNSTTNSSSSGIVTPGVTTKPSTSLNGTSGINTASESSNGVNVSMIAGIAAGVVVIVALIAFLAFRAGKKRNEVPKTPDAEYAAVYGVGRNEHGTNGTYATDRSSSVARTHTRTHPSGGIATHTKSRGSDAAAGPGAIGLWSDRSIQSARIPLEAIELGEVLSRGAFGEVLRGSYDGQTVAIKRLLTERRKNMQEIETFLEEVKLVATLHHPRVVKFIGVAWDSLSDLCIVAEFMDGGDLRSLMSQYDSNNHPTGFNTDKVKIAMHIAHSLSYLHGLSPNVVHRDLKSKNVLLTKDLDAKLTDFGVSRLRADATMTAGVGSSLWMAPEVMIGERYSEKADIFSFGVVLSELDSQLLPYAHAFEPGSDRKLPEMAILQMVSMGRISVEFSEGADPDIVETARACVELDPADRPTANEVLHRFHHIWRHYGGFV